MPEMKAVDSPSMISKNRKGFALIEMLIVLAIMSVISTAIYSLFSYSNRCFTTQNVSADVQQNLRASMEIIIQDIRSAGLDPTASGIFGIELAAERKLRFTSDSLDTAVGDFNGVIDDVNSERMTYEFQGNYIYQTLYEGTASEVTQPLIEGVDILRFTYFDGDENSLGNSVDAGSLKDIRQIEISLTIQEPAGPGEPVSRTLTKRVQCRNLGLN